MTSQRLRPVVLTELLDALFAADAPEMRISCEQWCAVSPRFTTFLERYRDKIRKKLRGVADAEGRRDLRAELLTAACLLTERAFTLDYEKYTATKTRGPDFSLLYKTHTPCDVEVKRIRGQAQAAKWADVLCDKLRQLPPGGSNVLVIYNASWGQGATVDVGAVMAQVLATAERKEDAFFTRRGLDGAREYLRQLPKLSVVVVRGESPAEGTAALANWINPQARHPLTADLRNALLRSLEAL